MNVWCLVLSITSATQQCSVALTCMYTAECVAQRAAVYVLTIATAMQVWMLALNNGHSTSDSDDLCL
jgi:hypothetical protein